MNYSTTADFALRSAAPLSKSTTWVAAAARMLRDALGVPELSPDQRVVRDAAKVRTLAYGYRDIDPSFASDLYAAADRHEQSIEAGVGAKA